MPTVFNFDTRHVIEYLIVSNVDVVRHADIDSGILNFAQYVVLDKTVMTELGENAVKAGVDDPVVSDREVISRLPHDGIAFVLGYFEPLDAEAVS